MGPSHRALAAANIYILVRLFTNILLLRRTDATLTNHPIETLWVRISSPFIDSLRTTRPLKVVHRPSDQTRVASRRAQITIFEWIQLGSACHRKSRGLLSKYKGPPHYPCARNQDLGEYPGQSRRIGPKIAARQQKEEPHIQKGSMVWPHPTPLKRREKYATCDAHPSTSLLLSQLQPDFLGRNLGHSLHPRKIASQR